MFRMTFLSAIFMRPRRWPGLWALLKHLDSLVGGLDNTRQVLVL